MKAIRIVLPVVLVLSLAGFAFSQEPREEEKPPERAQPKPEAEHNGARQDEAKPAQNEAKPAKPEQKEGRQDQQGQKEQKQEADKPPRNEMTPNREEKPVGQERGEQAQQPHGRPAGQSARIPDDKFRANFGRQHTFAVRQTVIVEGQPRFQYSGYWLGLSDPWPPEWAYTDDCYVDYIDGEYFLFDLLHPGMRIALFVAM